MGTHLARVHDSGHELAHIAPIDTFRPLDRYSEGLSDEQPRVPWLATISAGYKDAAGYPKASRRQDTEWIHMTAEDQERAPGLFQALQTSGFRWLDVAVPFDDPALFIQQRFEKRSATRLEAYGDERELTEIRVRKVQQGQKTVEIGERLMHPAGSVEYRRLVRECSVSVSFFFVLARWDGRQPRLYFPASDGLGVYRLRFTSRHSLREVLASLRQISSLTGGRLAGIPLRLTLDWREVADPTGARRTIGVWKPRFIPPQGLELTPPLWQDLAKTALAEGQLLRLPAPSVESIDDATDTLDVDMDDPPPSAAIAALQDGPVCDAGFYERAWFVRVRGSVLDSDEARAGFLRAFSHGATDSLREFLESATEERAAALLAAAGRHIAVRSKLDNARKYDEVFGNEDEGTAYDLKRKPTRNPAGDLVDTATGEVLEERAAPSRTSLWDENRRLIARAAELGLTGAPTLPNRSTEDVIAEANRELAERIQNFELDQREQEQQRQQEKAMF